MRWPARVAAVLALALLAGLAGPLPAAQAHPYHLQIANESISGSDSVDSVNWIAQSIVPTSVFYVSRASLFVGDSGPSDDLTVSIRPDVSGSPSTTVLTQGTVDGPTTATWVDFDMSPYVPLSAFSTYWIVARSTAPPGSGYDWFSSPNNFAYLPGIGVRSTDGNSWTPRGRDFAFRVYGFVQPGFAFSVSSTGTSLRPGQSAVFQVNFTNSGPGSSEALWVNLSFPPALTYMSDDASSLGGFRSGSSFEFRSIQPGAYSFNVTVAAAGGTPDGAVATTTFSFDGKDHNGAPLVQSQLSLSISIRNARLTISLEPSTLAADPGDLITMNATIADTGTERASNILVEAPLDLNTTFVDASPPAAYDSGSRTVFQAVSPLNPGSSSSMKWTVAVRGGTADQTAIALTGMASYADPSGATMPRERATLFVHVRAPSFAPVLLLDLAAAERGEEVVATVFFNNTGSVASPFAWANWSLGGNYELLGLLPPQPYTIVPGGFSVTLPSVASGSHALLARLRVLHGFEDGFVMPIRVTWDAMDGNLNPQTRTVLDAFSVLRAPEVSVSIIPLGPRVATGSVFQVTVLIDNVGTASARGWLNISLPAGVDYVGDSGTSPPTIAGREVSWTFGMIPAGGALSLAVSLESPSGPAVGSLRFQLDYTDASRISSLTTFSNAEAVEFAVPPGSGFAPYMGWIILAVAGIVAGIAVVEWKRRGPSAAVDEVFVADPSGILLAHRAASPIGRQDEDLLVAMFKVVQDFVRDAFSRDKKEEVRVIEFGQKKIQIERGKHHFIAVIYRGMDHGDLAGRMRKVSREIDEKFGAILSTWSGEVETVKGIALLLPQIWRRRRFPVKSG